MQMLWPLNVLGTYHERQFKQLRLVGHQLKIFEYFQLF